MIDKNGIPRHIAIIMDGNGRWAREKGLPRILGHREGIERVKEIVESAREFGIDVMTLFAFSSENWNRPKREISMLMRYLSNFLEKEAGDLHRKNVRLMFIGRTDPVPEYVQKKINQAVHKTKDNTGLTLVLALNYGSRQEIVDAVKKFTHDVVRGKIRVDDLSPEVFGTYFYTCGLADPDLLIRTSGEMRISNFLLWQISYSELYFSKKYWPEFKKEDLREAINEYQKRERRFGGINACKKNN